jgi:S1-C subfamily serine protease
MTLLRQMMRLGFLILVPLSAPSPQTGRQVAQKTFPSVVLLVMQDANRQPVSLGSGFFVSDGTVATNLHVIEGTAAGHAKLIGKEITYDIAGVIGTDDIADLALLRINGAKAPPLELGDSKQLAVGDEIYAVGNPKGLEGTFSQGIVSGIRSVGSDTLLQITAPISPGSSGGPVVDNQGKVIGVAVATFKGGQNLNFAVPISYLKALISKTSSASVRPISSSTNASGRNQSIVSAMGAGAREGVIGSKFLWESYVSSGFTFTLENKLSIPVKNIYLLVVFYASDGSPLDVVDVRYENLIPAGLGRRVTARVDYSVKKMTTKNFDDPVPLTKVEFRVLDFELVD